jgi:hypothetical protein
MSALGQKQTLQHVRVMSALPPKADIGQRRGHVRFVPKADIVRCGKINLLDHLISGDAQRLWHRDAECLG